MNKQGMIDAVHQELGGTKADAERAVEKVVSSIVENLKQGEDVSISGLGIFTTNQRAARTARNPQTGEQIQVPAMRVPKFKPAKGLKDTVKES